ncbi:MAG: hypothetical protein NZM26_02370 [Patescibacteria group bacterium]|nr:hypothetical protein [Patescibacteria group bacterium]
MKLLKKTVKKIPILGQLLTAIASKYKLAKAEINFQEKLKHLSPFAYDSYLLKLKNFLQKFDANLWEKIAPTNQNLFYRLALFYELHGHGGLLQLKKDLEYLNEEVEANIAKQVSVDEKKKTQ